MSLFFSSLLPLKPGVSDSSHCRGWTCREINMCCYIFDNEILRTCVLFLILERGHLLVLSFSHMWGCRWGNAHYFVAAPVHLLVGCCVGGTQAVSGQIFALTRDDNLNSFAVFPVFKQEQEQTLQPKQHSSPC